MEHQGDARGPVPRLPLLPVASHFLGGVRIYGFFMVVPLLTAAEPRFGLGLGGNRSSLGAGLTPPAHGLRAAARDRASQRKTTLFSPPNPPQVPARRARGVFCRQLFPSRASPGLRKVELGKAPLCLLPTPRCRTSPGTGNQAVPGQWLLSPLPTALPKPCLYLLAPVHPPCPGEPPGRAEAKAK